jgi:hypothetical protein
MLAGMRTTVPGVARTGVLPTVRVSEPSRINRSSVSPRRRFAASKPGQKPKLLEQPDFERLLDAKLPNLSSAGA